MFQQLRRAKRTENGFTLIELLIVIVILGILAAVVVFAVNGIQDRGKVSACKADVSTVAIAAEAYNAQTGDYAKNMDTLVEKGLLKSVPLTDNYTVDYQVADDGNSVDVSSAYCSADALPSSSGGPSTSADATEYCKALQATLSTMSGLDIYSLDDEGFNGLISSFKTLSAVAPDGINKDWDAFVEALTDVRAILAGAGLRWNDQNALYSGELPGGLTQEQADELINRLQEPLRTERFQTAGNHVGETAQELCGGLGFKD